MATSSPLGVPRYDFERLEGGVAAHGITYFVILAHTVRARTWMTDEARSSMIADGIVCDEENYPLLVKWIELRGFTIREPGRGLPPVFA